MKTEQWSTYDFYKANNIERFMKRKNLFFSSVLTRQRQLLLTPLALPLLSIMQFFLPLFDLSLSIDSASVSGVSVSFTVFLFPFPLSIVRFLVPLQLNNMQFGYLMNKSYSKDEKEQFLL